jgi:CheY-like chemotaxis protein/HPt (histidine-containing phosphotransfer) domain-containing protein
VSLPFNKSHENISNASGASNSSALAIDQHPPPYSDSVSPTVPESPRFVTDQYFVYSPLSKAVESAEHGHLKPLYPLTEETRSLPTPPLTIPFPMKILVAEDNKTNQLIAKNLLNLPNCSVDIVSNGQEAFEMLKNNTYHLVLMDVQMPIMNGMVATRLIRSPDSEVVDPNIPIVAMTACVTTTHRDKCLSAGMNDFLSKPINSDELMAVIHRYCPKKPPLPISSFNDSPEPETDCFIFDPQGLSLRLRNDKDLCRELIEVFLTDVPQLITQLKIALADGQLPQAQHIAHTIKGAAKNVNAEALAQHSQAIETLTKEQNLDGAQAKLVFLEAAFDRLKLELDKFVIAVAT